MSYFLNGELAQYFSHSLEGRQATRTNSADVDAPASDIERAMAELPSEDRKLALAQKVCPVSGEPPRFHGQANQGNRRRTAFIRLLRGLRRRRQEKFRRVFSETGEALRYRG
jgi:hypothetical protein